MNGDSYTGANLADLISEHEQSKSDASILVVAADGRDDCGFIRIDGQHRICSFDEKSTLNPSKYLNAGIYVISRNLIAGIPPQTSLSLEKDVFPAWLKEGRRIHASIFAGHCVDIGTPERYKSAQQCLSSLAN
jgi:NDP-sugar pyrophosphorylase family protein